MAPFTASGSSIVYNMTPPKPPRFPPPATFKLGDFVTVMQGRKEVPAIIVEVDLTRVSPYRVSGWYADVNYVWSDWYYRDELAHDLG
jgi:hypothetical protein